MALRIERCLELSQTRLQDVHASAGRGGDRTEHAIGVPAATCACHSRRPRIERILHAIDTRYTEPDLSLAKLAREHNMSTWHLCRLITRNALGGFRCRLHDARCSQAFRLLVGTTLSIKEIAAAVGYNETRSLDRQFRKRYSCVPSVHRRRVMSVLDTACDMDA